MSLKALIFDLDGTLAETEDVHRKAFNETFAASSFDWYWSHDLYKRLLGVAGSIERMAAYQEQAVPPSDHISRCRLAELHTAKTRRYAEILRSRRLALRPGVARLIDEARANGLRLAIATSTSRPNVDLLLDTCFGSGADTIFDVIASGSDVTRKKPAPDLYLRAIERLGIDAERCIAIEDSRIGVRSAKAAGLRVVATPSRYTVQDDFWEADLRVSSLEQIDMAMLRAIEGQPALPCQD